MRNVIVVAFALSPLMLHAQAAQPAQPQSTDGPAVRISSVHQAKLIHTVDIETPSALTASPIERTVDVAMNIDETGKPSDLKIVRSSNPVVDKSVLDAVSEYRFAPATLDDQPVAVAANLRIVLR